MEETTKKALVIGGSILAAAGAAVGGYFALKKGKKPKQEEEPIEVLGWEPPKEEEENLTVGDEHPPEGDIKDTELSARTADIQGEDKFTPYEITAEQYEAEERYYNKEALYWHIHDEILADDNGEEIPKPEKLLGSRLIALLRVTEEAYIYVRNDLCSTDYEIIRTEEPYEAPDIE